MGKELPLKSLAVVVPKKEAQRVMREISRYIEKRLKPKQVGDKVLIPVKEAPEGYEVVEEEFEERKRSVSLNECLERKLGKGEWPRSYSVIGDIAVISINRDEILKYSKEIAECIMSNQRVKAVWGKVQTEGVERVAKLVHLGGERRTETVYKEHGMKFRVDIAKVYINPSFAEEHAAVAGMIEDGEKVFDAFAGLGFFSFHISKRVSATSFALDINPNAVKLMIENIEMNKKILKGTIVPILGDFNVVSKSFKDKYFDVVIMNLPHKSHEFLKEGLRLARRAVILYSVGKEEEVRERFKNYDVIQIKKVIDYAPYKFIWRVMIKP